MIRRHKNQFASDDGVESAESAMGALVVRPVEGAGGESSLSPAVLSPSRSSHTKIGAFSPPGILSPARLPDSPLPPPREPSVLLDATLMELNRQRDLLRETLHPMNAEQLDEWVTIQLQRDCIVRASFCQTSNDVLLAEVRRLRQVVTNTLNQLSCPSSPVLLLRGALEQVLSSLPGVVQHLRCPRPHADLEEGSSPHFPRRKVPPPPLQPCWVSELKGVQLFSDIPVFPDSFMPGREEPRRGSPSRTPDDDDEGGVALGRRPSGGRRRFASSAVAPSWGSTTSNEGDLEPSALLQRRRDRRRVRSEELRARKPSPEPLILGESVEGRRREGTDPVVVVAGGGGRRWISPSLLQEGEAPDNVVDGSGMGAEGGCYDDDDSEGLPIMDVELPPLPMPELPPMMLQKAPRGAAEGDSSSVRAPPSFAAFGSREGSLSSTGSSQSLVFRFTDEEQLGIRRGRRAFCAPMKFDWPSSSSSSSSSSYVPKAKEGEAAALGKGEMRKTTTTPVACTTAPSSSTTDVRTETTTTTCTKSTTECRTSDQARDYDTSMTLKEFSGDDYKKQEE